MSSNTSKLFGILRRELSPPRSWLPLFFGFVWSSRPLLHPETGWMWWPDLIFESMTAYLLYDLCKRVRRAWYEPTTGL